MMDLVTRLGRHSRLLLLVVGLALAWVPIAHAMGIGHHHGHGSSQGVAGDQAGHVPPAWLISKTPFCCQGVQDCAGAATFARNSPYPISSLLIRQKPRLDNHEFTLPPDEPPPRIVA